MAVSGPAVEAAKVKDVPAPPRPAHTRGAVEVAEAHHASLWEDGHPGAGAVVGYGELVEAHGRAVLLQLLEAVVVVVLPLVVPWWWWWWSESELFGWSMPAPSSQEERRRRWVNRKRRLGRSLGTAGGKPIS